jgi:hypothetical protein
LQRGSERLSFNGQFQSDAVHLELADDDISGRRDPWLLIRQESKRLFEVDAVSTIDVQANTGLGG